MNINLATTPQYQVLTGGNTYNFSVERTSSGQGAVNVIPKVFDCDLVAGALTINLMSIDSLFRQGNFGVGFGFFMTIRSNAPINPILINAFQSEDGSDTICGANSASFNGVGTAIFVHVAGHHNWLALRCLTPPSLP